VIRRLLAVFITVASPLSAQQWKVEVQGGRIRSALDPEARPTTSVAAGLAYEDLTTLFRISTGVPTKQEAPYWGSAALWKRLAAKKGAFIAGVDLTGNAYAFQDRVTTRSGGGLFDPITTSSDKRTGNAFAGQALPLVAIESGAFQLQARAGVSYYRATIENQSKDRTVKLGDIQLTFRPTPSIALIPVVKRFQARAEKASTFAGASAVIAQDRLSLWGSAGQWLGDSSATSWNAGGSLRFTDRASFIASARHDGLDPLYLSPAQTSWSAGISFIIGGNAGISRAPVPAVYKQGQATIRIPVSQTASQPSVAGDFNGWKPAQMERDGKFWSYTVAANPGVYNYAFVAPDGSWFVPENVPGRKDDGMGGHVAVLVVR
jgi:hypothetical protein